MSSMPPICLKSAIAQMDALPPLPMIAQKLMALDLDTDQGERQMLSLIEQDPQIAARIVGLANSPLFGMSKRVTSVSDAAMLMGMRRVKTVTLGMAMMASLTPKATGKLDAKQLWLHSLSVAMAMRAVARAMPARLRPLDDEIFLSGLLHDMGFMVLCQLDPILSDALHTQLQATGGERSVLEIEAELMDMGHSELGAELASKWDLPDAIVTVLRHHHRPAQAGGGAVGLLVQLVFVAEKCLVDQRVFEGRMDDITEADWQALGIDSERAAEVLAAATGAAEEAKTAAGSLG